MYKTSYVHEVRKEKYERSDVFDEEPVDSESSAGISAIQGWESLQELNSRFARYINRARVLEQRNAVFRKQLETLQRMEEASGLEEAFTEQTEVNRQRIRELSSDHAKLQRELKDACRMMDEFTSKYRNECDYQEQLRGTLEQLNKEADSSLLRNLEYQIQSQFLQDDINSTRDRHKKNLAEIQTYVNILQQINQTLPLAPNVSAGISEEQEKLLAQRKVPGLQSQLEEYKSALCQLQGQKQRLQAETAVLEQSIKNTQESYDNEIQMYNEQIESLRKEIEEAERSLEKFTSECRHLAMYQTSLENELERYKRIIENEDNRLNSAIIGTPITLFTTNYRYTHTPTASSRGRDITQAIQDITSIKPRQKILAKKVLKKKELTPKDAMESGQEERNGGAAGEGPDDETKGIPSVEVQEKKAKRKEQRPVLTGVSPQDVPDGAQISKAFDTLCNIVRDRMRKYKKPEPIADFYTKGRYVLVTGDGSYPDPCFYTSTPSAGHIFVTIRDDMMPPYEPYRPAIPSPPTPPPIVDPRPLDPTLPSNGGGEKDDKGGKGKDNGGKGKHKGREPHPHSKNPTPVPPPFDPKDPTPDDDQHKKSGDDHRQSGPTPKPAPRGASTSSSSSSSANTSTSTSSGSYTPDAMSYEKLEVVESVEKFSDGRRVKGYEETSMVVETMIEKSSKKKN
ncbi:filensin [Perca flavescens]|uniref:filensin n=1 Tax=Perca flavescens TaxID=8167 RepID=UPI00106E8450|nr:filensin [Perca flavescens]XP_028459429.1 filensin [Perca flavescens]XP_028459430.1 filensin [Perca flavescens]